MDEKSGSIPVVVTGSNAFLLDSSLDFYWKLPRSIGQTASTIGQS